MKDFLQELARTFETLRVYAESSLLKKMRERKKPLLGAGRKEAEGARNTLIEIRRLIGDLEACISIGLDPGGPYGKWKKGT